MNLLDDVRYLKPLQALRSVRALIANPENTGEVFKIIEALKGDSLARAVARMEADPQGSALLRAKPDILPVLSDREGLRALPAGSLGRAYLDFVESQYLSADGLVEASEEAPRGREKTPGEIWLANRLRDIHDLQHVMCGYGRDELGELCLLAFMCAQTHNRGIAFIIFMARRKFRQEAPQIDIDACVAEGRRTGERAKWFATVNWEQRLAEPLDSLRSELGVSLPGVYRDALRALERDCCAGA
ncbi:MAG: Coq4 family protein [Halieaceae bacterium]|jgi:ubiquinone biosynthesis protein COQ4|nr:Coq4 family protein [Halieaceae bacterium]